MSNIKVMKMWDGTDVVAVVTSTIWINGKIKMYHPCVLSIYIDDEGKNVVNWVPYFPYTVEGIEFKYSDVKGWANPTKDIIDEYNKIFKRGV